MIHKDKLKGKYITYLDKNKSYRTHKVIKINGNTLTVKDVLGTRSRVHPDKNKIIGRQLKNSIEEIEWN